DLFLNGTQIDKPVAWTLSVGVNARIQGKPLIGELTADGVVDLMGRKIQIEPLAWKMKGLSLQARGKVSGFSNPSMDLALKLSDISLSDLSSWVSLPKEIRISGSPSLEIGLKG